MYFLEYSWSVPEFIYINYSTTDDNFTSKFEITNHGFDTIYFIIESDRYTFSKKEGYISDLEEIEFSGCIPGSESCDPLTDINIICSGFLEDCYKDLTIHIIGNNTDCNYSDYEMYFEDEKYERIFYFELKNETTCRGGELELTDLKVLNGVRYISELFYCNLTLFIIAIIIIFISYIIMFLKNRYIYMSLRTQTWFTVFYTIGYILFTIPVFFSDINCYINTVLIGLGSSVMFSGLLSMSQYLVSQVIRKKLIFDIDLYYYVKRFIPNLIFSIILIIFTSSNNEKLENEHLFYGYFSVKISCCGREGWRYVMLNLMPV